MSQALKGYRELAPGGTIRRSEAGHPKTGSWRTEGKPVVDATKCVNCLLCWVNCPDSAIVIDGASFVGFDYDYCKGCALCVEVCPTNAIELADEHLEVSGYGRVQEERV